MPPLAGTAFPDLAPTPDPARWLARALEAERVGLDFVVVEAGPADAALVAALLAARTQRVGIVVQVATATSEPFHVSTQLATIDFVSRGRAGWLVDLAPDPARTVTWPAPADVVADAREHVDVVRGLWDTWEDGAEVRDAAAGRFLDRDRVHHLDVRGGHIAVRGPSITPRPPQGHPPVLADEALGDLADVVLAMTPPASGRPWLQLLAPQDIGDADPSAAAVLVRPPDGDVEAATAAAATLGRASTGTLRERLGLPAAANRFAAGTTR